jgi:putative heme transporter
MVELPNEDEITAEGMHALRVPAEIVEQELAHKSLSRRIAEIVLSLAVTVLIFVFAIPAITQSKYSEIFDELGRLTAGQFIALFLVWGLVLLTYTGVLTAALPGLSHPQALVVNLSGSAVSNVVPFGGAVGVGATYAMTLSWGFDVPAVTLSILVTGIWNVFMKLGLPIVALLILIVAGRATATLVAPALIALAVLIAGIVVLTLILRSEQLADRIGAFAQRAGGRMLRVIRKPPPTTWRQAVLDFRHQSIDLLRTRWKRLTLWMIVYNAGQFLLLLFCVRVLGADTHELGWIEVLAAFSFANVLTTIAITPSGVGFVEAGAVAALIAFGGPETASAAAVFLFRGFTYLMEIPLGAVGWAVWGTRRSWRRPVGSRAETATAP